MTTQDIEQQERSCIELDASSLSQSDIEAMQMELRVVRSELGFPMSDEVTPLDVSMAIRALKTTMCHMIDERNRAVTLLNDIKRQLADGSGNLAGSMHHQLDAQMQCIIQERARHEVLSAIPHGVAMSREDIEKLFAK